MKQVKLHDDALLTEDKEENEEAVVAAEETEIAAGEAREVSRALRQSTVKQNVLLFYADENTTLL
jgi:hypothetical protein